MSKARDSVAGSSSSSDGAIEASGSVLGPDLELKTFDDGYVRFKGFEEAGSLFSGYNATLDKLDDYGCNVVASPDQSAEILEHYLGQHSNNMELRERLGDIDETILEREEVTDLDNSIVLELETTDYDEGQHVYRHEGEVVPEVAEYLAKESCWSDQVHYVEGEMLFIRSNP